MARSTDSRRQRRGQALAQQAEDALALAENNFKEETETAAPPSPDAETRISSPILVDVPRAARQKDDDELASFMSADIQEGKRIRKIEPTRLLLTFAVFLAFVVLFRPLLDELRYHFHDAKAAYLGNVEEIKLDPPLPINAYVSLTGVFGNKAATIQGIRPNSLRRGPVQVRQLLGSQIYAEFDQNKHPKYTQFTEVTLEGRLADFGPNSELTAVRSYFINTHGLRIPKNARLLIVDEKPGQMWRYPIAFLLAILLMFSSLVSLMRSLRTRVVEDDNEMTPL